MIWVTWLRRTGGVATDRPTVSAPQPAEREIPLCSFGSDVTVLIAAPTDVKATFRAKVAVVDGDRIVLTGTTGAQPDDDAEVTLRWTVESGERHVPVTVQATTATTWTLQAVGDVTHRQHRRWVRVRATVPVAVRQQEHQTWTTGHTVNLSAGGMAAAFENALDDMPSPYLVDITLELPDGTLTMTGTVLEVTEAEHGSAVRVSFSDVTDACHEQLAGYVAQVQREELARRHQQGTAADAP